MLDFAAELFEFWDTEKNGILFCCFNITIGYLPLDTLVKDMLSLGLAPSSEVLLRMISLTLKRPLTSLVKDQLTVKEF